MRQSMPEGDGFHLFQAAHQDLSQPVVAELSVDALDAGRALFSAFGERQVSTIYTSTDSYQVILQVGMADRADEAAFRKIYLRAGNGALVPLSSVASVKREAGPVAINHAG